MDDLVDGIKTLLFGCLILGLIFLIPVILSGLFIAFWVFVAFAIAYLVVKDMRENSS